MKDFEEGQTCLENARLPCSSTSMRTELYYSQYRGIHFAATFPIWLLVESEESRAEVVPLTCYSVVNFPTSSLSH